MKEIIQHLIVRDCFKQGEFTLKSNIKSKYYFDLRLLISYPNILKQISELLFKLISSENINLEKTKICGLPYAGMPYANTLSIMNNISMIMLRKEKKMHGTKKMVEGEYKQGDSLIIIDDILTTGSSIIESLKHLREFKIKHIFVIIDREEGGKAKLEKLGYKVHSLFTLRDFLN